MCCYGGTPQLSSPLAAMLNRPISCPSQGTINGGAVFCEKSLLNSHKQAHIIYAQVLPQTHGFRLTNNNIRKKASLFEYILINLNWSYCIMNSKEYLLFKIECIWLEGIWLYLWADLGNMYQLLRPVQGGLQTLITEVEEHIKFSGVEAISNLKGDNVRRTLTIIKLSLSVRLCLSLFFCVILCVSLSLCLCVSHLYDCVSHYLFVCLSLSACLCLSVSVFLCHSMCLSISLSLCFSVFICLSICLSFFFCVIMFFSLYLCLCVFHLYVCVYLSVCLPVSVCLFIFLCHSVCLSISLSLCFSVFICLSICLSLHFSVS